jgi:hypothetical protein
MEIRARGSLPSLAVGITVCSDALAIILFVIASECVLLCCSVESSFSPLLATVFGVSSLVLTVIVGVAVGGILMIALSREEPPQWLLGCFTCTIAFAVFPFSQYIKRVSSGGTHHPAHTLIIEPLLLLIVSGALVSLRSSSRTRHRFRVLLHKLAPFVFLPFFVFTGASLSIKHVIDSWPLALGTVVARTCAHVIGCATRRNALPTTRRWLFALLLAQAGVTLGLANECAARFPRTGKPLRDIIVVVVFVFQIVGPVLCRWGFVKSYQSTDRQGDEEIVIENESGEGGLAPSLVDSLSPLSPCYEALVSPSHAASSATPVEAEEAAEALAFSPVPLLMRTTMPPAAGRERERFIGRAATLMLPSRGLHHALRVRNADDGMRHPFVTMPIATRPRCACMCVVKRVSVWCMRVWPCRVEGGVGGGDTDCGCSYCGLGVTMAWWRCEATRYAPMSE